MNTGTRVGPFEIAAPLGAGGMGEVYRARDLRLRRDVALKVLPQSLALDSDRRTRFEREARVLASLNHPNIATLYGVEDTPSGQVLVMELVEGTTLADRLALARRGSSELSLRESLSIAHQLATALEAAHAHGVIHGDIKPANVAVRQDGTVKVLDFGLATTRQREATGIAETATVTELTSGTFAGTPAYMSPEQIRGARPDTRTDIWAFGCVLYELLAGQRAFAGDQVSDVAAKILEREPDFAAVPVTTPPPIRRLLERCLAKDSSERLRDIGDARLELRDALAGKSDSAVVAAPTARAGFPLWRWPVAALAIALLAGAGGWALANRAPARPAPVVRLSIPAMEPPYLAPFGDHHLAISADGSRIAYSSASRLIIRRLDQQGGVSVEEITSGPFFSPDGEWVGFFNRGGGLKKIPVRGGASVPIAEISGRPAGATWGADGTIVFATTEGLYRVSEKGGDVTLLQKPDTSRKERGYAWPGFIGRSRSLLFTIVSDGGIEAADAAVLDVDTGVRQVVLQGAADARYVPTGHLVYASGQKLYAIAFDRATLRTHGEAAAIPDIDIATAPDNGAGDFAVADSGTLVFLAPGASGRAPGALYWVDRAGKEEPLPIAPAPYWYPRVSPDGSRIALDLPGANRDIWIWSAERPSLTRVTSGPSEDVLPTWSPGGRLFFGSQRNGNFDIYSQAADGATAERVEFSGPGDQMPVAFTPDGRLILNENFKDISVLTLSGTPRVTPLLHTDANEWVGEVSPDGKWFAYESNEAGDRVEIFVRPFDDLTARRDKVSINGGRYPAWARDGRELYYVDLDGAMMAVPVTLEPRLALGAPRKLFDYQKPPRTISGRPYDISPVDGRFLIVRPVAGTPQRDIDIPVILNWFEELRRVVPAR